MSAPNSGKPKGGKKKMIHHKGGNRRFTDFEELKMQAAEIQRMKLKEDSDSDNEKAGPANNAQNTRTVSFSSKPVQQVDVEKSSSDKESTDDEDSDNEKHKGIEHLIEIENPNRVTQKMKKVTDLKLESTELSRREREAIEKERKKQDYLRLHALGKTEEAQADLARLQIIRKQREEAAKKREDDKQAKQKAEKSQQEQKLAGGVSVAKT